jgi:hypothetical protein
MFGRGWSTAEISRDMADKMDRRARTLKIDSVRRGAQSKRSRGKGRNQILILGLVTKHHFLFQNE